MHRKLWLGLFLSIANWWCGILAADGFALGTLVKVPTGYVPIEELKVGDQVCAAGPVIQQVGGCVIEAIQNSAFQAIASDSMRALEGAAVLPCG